MKKIALAAGTLLLAAAGAASAQTYYYSRDYEPSRDRAEAIRGDAECWNGRAGTYERVRPGEYQNDLDFNRCRAVGERSYRDRSDYRDRYESRNEYRNGREQCWNGRARTFEDVRAGEVQNDLDFSRCRMVR